MDLVIRGGKVLSGERIVEATIGIRGGRITLISEPDSKLRAAAEIDARDRLILPGLIDAHVHLRDPGLTHKEDFATGTRAAARGGVTTVADMPNVSPPTTTAQRFLDKRNAIAPKAHVDYMLWAGAVDSLQFEPLRALGAVGAKLYMTQAIGQRDNGWTGKESPYLPELFVSDDWQLLDIFERAAAVGIRIAVHLGNQRLIERSRLGWRGKAFSEVAAELVLESRLAKIEAFRRCALFSRETGAWLHVVHVSPALVPEVAAAKAAGIHVTAESSCPFLSFDDMAEIGPLGFDRYNSAQENGLLWEAMRSRVIEIMATDHAPHTYEEKMMGHTDILRCPSGYPELETVLPMLMDEVHRRRITLPQLAQVFSMGPAALLGISARKGAIALGMDADLVLIDPEREDRIDPLAFESKAKWSPFAGRRVRGWPTMTLVRGEVVAADGEVVGEPGHGRFLGPSGQGGVEA